MEDIQEDNGTQKVKVFKSPGLHFYVIKSGQARARHSQVLKIHLQESQLRMITKILGQSTNCPYT